jgi:2-methylcitrate dehydratase PrpD
MAHALEYDDLHSELPVHCGCVTIPTAMAVAETDPDLSGAELVSAIVTGTEILCRLARATRSYRTGKGFRGFNPTSVVAGFAAAAVAGRLLRLDANGIARAMGLSYSQASGTQQCIEDGGLAKRMQPGMVAEAGVRAAWLARAGVTGAVDAIEGANGYFRVFENGEYDADLLTKDLGTAFEMDAIAFKRYPICGMAQPAVDALRELRDQHRFEIRDVAKIRVYGSKFVVDMVGRPYEPGENPDVDAQFSIRYCIATTLLTGSIKLVDLKAENALGDERANLANAITVELDDTPKGKWSTRIEIELCNGVKLTRSRETAAGQSDRRVSMDELAAKFIDCAAFTKNRVRPTHAKKLCKMLIDLPRLPRLAKLFDTLSS